MKKIFLLMIIFSTMFIYSGELDDFEKGIWDSNEPDSDYDYDSDSGSGDSCAGDACVAGCEICTSEAGQECVILSVGAIVHGGALSYDIATGDGEEKKREDGSFLLPFVRLDTNISYNTENVYSLNNRLEIGFGPIAVDFNYNLYKEKDFFNDKMKVLDYSLSYRMSITRSVEIGLSMGASTLLGNNSLTGFKLGVPFRFTTSEGWGFECRPSFIFLENTSLFDFDISAFWGMKYFGFTAGYKAYGTENNYLHGPYIGVRTLY